MFCPKCGAKLSGDTIFCPKCGAHVKEQEVQKSESNEFDDTIIMKPVELPDGYKITDKKETVKKAPKPTHSTSSRPKTAKIKEQSSSNNSQKITIIILSVCIAVMLIVLAVFAFKLANAGKNNEIKNPSGVSDTKDDEKKTEEKKESKKEEKPEKTEVESAPKIPESYSTIPVDMVYASSERTEDENAFSASNATDSKLSTAWSPENYAGAGESITLCFSSERKVHGIKISNGYSKSGEDYSQNSRVKNITVKFPDGSICTAELKDGVMSMQAVDFGQEISCRTLTVYIDSVYESESQQPVYVSEIEVF